MARRNHARSRPQARRRQDGTRGRATPPPPPVEALVIPQGRCFAFSRKGKLKFTKAQAPTALKQAQQSRARRGSGHAEERIYECPGCGFWHLTSRTHFEERGRA